MGDTTYCVTGEGLMLYHNGNFGVYTTVNGSHSVDFSLIFDDNYKNAWIRGKSPNSFEQIYNIEEKIITSTLSII